MLPFRDSRLAKIAAALFFVVVLGYAYYETRGILYGPRITLPETMEVSERFITLKGRADRIAALRMNGTPISVSEDGTFEEPYLLAPGLNRIVFDAQDKYGRDRREVLEIVYTASEEEPLLPTIPAASSTATTTTTSTSTATTSEEVIP